MSSEEQQGHLFWFNLGMDLGLVLSSCFLKNTQDPEVRKGYEKIEERVLKLKIKILKGNHEKEDMEEFDDEAECIIGDYVELVDKK
jgi:hypothetical protein